MLSGSGSWRLSLKLESSLCPGLGGKCPGGLQAGQVCGGREEDPVPLLKEEYKLRYGGRRKQGCEENSRYVLV